MSNVFKKICIYCCSSFILGCITTGISYNVFNNDKEALEYAIANKQDINIVMNIKNGIINNSALDNQILTEKQINHIMTISNNKLTDNERRLYVKYIVKYSREYKLPPVLVAAIIHRESNFRKHLVSSVGARGCMQVFPKYHKEKLKKSKITADELHTIKYGIKIGCEVIAEYLKVEQGNYREALYRYVGGKHHGYVKDIFELCHKTYNIV